MFPMRGDEFCIKTRSYITTFTLHKLPSAMRIKYDEFIREGSLIVMEGAILDIWDDLVSKEDPEDPIYYNIRNLEQLMYYKTRLEELGSI